MNYRLTLTDGTERFFEYAGEILQFAEAEWPQRSCKFAPVLLIPTGLDEWQLQGIDMRVLGRVERSDQSWLSRQLTPVEKPERILEGEILGPNDWKPIFENSAEEIARKRSETWRKLKEWLA